MKTQKARIKSRLERVTARWEELSSHLNDPDLFQGLDRESAIRWCAYLFGLPKKEGAVPSLRSHVLGLYDPFAMRAVFPAGIRFCCNVYVGCGHGCLYCYNQTYNRLPRGLAKRKMSFRESLEKDFGEIEHLGLSPVPLHISNSTDPLQEALETRCGDTRYLLQCLARGKSTHFTAIRILTRNPALLTQPEYLGFLRDLGSQIVIQVSLPIVNEEAWRYYEPKAPSPQGRMAAVERLCSAGVGVSLRIDPLFPRDPLPPDIFGGTALADFGILPAQTETDLRGLARFAANCGCQSIIVSGLKVPRGRNVRDRTLVNLLGPLYKEAARNSPARMTGSYMRLPEAYQSGELIAPILEEAKRTRIKVEHCKHNLISTR